MATLSIFDITSDNSELFRMCVSTKYNNWPLKSLKEVTISIEATEREVVLSS
jgi:hypothetical protein